MKNLIWITAVGAFLVGCASSESELKETLRKNPKIVFDVIEENPLEFIEVVNRAAQSAQQKARENQFADQAKAQEKDLKNPKAPKLNPSRRLSGDDSGRIVLVEYADFQCPACGVGYEALKRFKEKYKGQVQFYYKNMPLDFHPMAHPAALYLEALQLQDSKKALQFYKYVFENQRELSDEAFLKKAATQVGADMKKLATDMKSDRVKKTIEEDMAEFQNFGFTGTPTIILNGVALNGAQKLEDLERVVQLTTAK